MKILTAGLLFMVTFLLSCSEDSGDDKKIVKYFTSGEKKFEVNKIDGQWWGEYKEWYASGVLKEKSNYEAGILHGEFKSWFENENLEVSHHTSRGVPVGKYLEYYENGSLFLDLNFGQEYEEDSNLSGVQKGWYSDGTPFFEFSIDQANQLTGALEIFHSNGQTRLKCEFDDEGLLSGNYWEKDPQGNLALKGFFKSGTKSGHWSFYSEWKKNNPIQWPKAKNAQSNEGTHAILSDIILNPINSIMSAWHQYSGYVTHSGNPMVSVLISGGNFHGPCLVYDYGYYSTMYLENSGKREFAPRHFLIFDYGQVKHSARLSQKNWWRSYLNSDDIDEKCKQFIRSELNISDNKGKGFFQSLLGF
ncbi:hypothetical protein N9N55_07855 [Opitutales bacterium]|nr:hypothetical protein [Opitutales bacterium]